MKPSFVTPIIKEFAEKFNLQINIEPHYGYAGQITLTDGRRRYFISAKMDLNPLGASEIAKDKAYASYFLKQLGYPVPIGREFFTDRWCRIIGNKRNWQAAYRYAKRLGWPVIVKPNSESQGSGVYLAHNKNELKQAVRSFMDRERVFLIQQVFIGLDYRIVVLDQKIISAYERRPLSITGDGLSTINVLLRKKQAMFNATKRNTIIPINDPRIDNTLKRLELSRNSRIEPDRRIVLLPNANLSTGGDAIDITARLHPDWQMIAINITKGMNLRFSGIDIISKLPLDRAPKEYVVLEINAAPGLDNYASLGIQQKKRVKTMYQEVIKALIQ